VIVSSISLNTRCTDRSENHIRVVFLDGILGLGGIRIVKHSSTYNNNNKLTGLLNRILAWIGIHSSHIVVVIEDDEE